VAFIIGALTAYGPFLHADGLDGAFLPEAGMSWILTMINTQALERVKPKAGPDVQLA
jgi:hypothetical protein